MKWTRRIKASALYFALLAATLIALLLSSFLLLSKTQRIFQLKNITLLNSLEAVTNGLDQTLRGSSTDAYSYNDRSVKLTQGSWGGFLFITATDTTDSFGLKKQALVGSFLKEKTSLILKDNFLPLVVAGKARIEGTAYLPERGIESAAIAGSYYLGDRLIYGPYRNVSSLQFPKLDSRWLDNTITLVNEIPEVNSSLLQELKNSFNKETLQIYSENPTWIDHKLSGKIILKSASEITITTQAELSEVVFVAPKVTVANGFSGVVHIVATDSIIVSEGVDLKYPSSLTLLDRSEEEMTGSIQIADGAQVAGNVIYFSAHTNDENLNANVLVSDSARVLGSIYANGAVELLGQLDGTLVCHNTVANQNSQKYRNYIFNGRITTDNLPREMAGLPLENNSKTVAQWLY